MLFLWKDKRWYNRDKRYSNRKGIGMISRKAFIDKVNQEGFSFNIQIPWWSYNNFKSLVWRKRLSEEQLYQIFLLLCREVEERQMQVVADKRKYQTRFYVAACNGREFRFEFVFKKNQVLRVFNLFETVNGRKKLTLMDLLDYIMDWRCIETIRVHYRLIKEGVVLWFQEMNF